jgi:L-ascorbate metabolism protein UlaG (beta-lactamase superfamily)
MGSAVPFTEYNFYMHKLALVLLFTAGSALCAAPEVFATAAGPLEITPIQHASLILKAGGKVMYVDPAQGSYDGLPQADYILITDIHGDHMAPAIVDKLRKPGTVILAPKAVADTVTGCTVVSNGESKTIGAFQVEAIPMYNLTADRLQFHTKGRGNGYVVAFGGKRLYFSGDTEGIPEMKALRNIDVAFVCMNLPYTMTPQEAAEAVRAFHPAVVYPYHYRGQDVTVFAKALAGTGIDVRLRDWYGK